MSLALALLVNNLGLFLLEIVGHHACHSVVMLLDGYYRLCQAILCTVRLFSRRIQSTYTPRHTYGLARVGAVGELVAFVCFFSLSISVLLETIKHLFDVVVTLPQRELNSSEKLTAHGSGEDIHSLIDHPYFILGVGIYATISNTLLGIAVLYTVMKRAAKLRRQLKKRRPSLKQPVPKEIMFSSLLITDSLPIHHSILQVLNMLLGPIAIFICGFLLVMLTEQSVRELYSRLVDPIIGCFLFLSYLLMIAVPLRDVAQLVLQANPHGLTTDQVEKTLRETIPGVASIHELHIWRLTPQRTLATVHIVFNTTDLIHTKYQDINLIFLTLNIDHVTIQPEFALTQNEIKQLGCHYRCSPSSVECGSLRCCDTINKKSDDDDDAPSIIGAPHVMHFHRRSSNDLHDSDGDSQSEKQQTTELVQHSPAIPTVVINEQ